MDSLYNTFKVQEGSQLSLKDIDLSYTASLQKEGSKQLLSEYKRKLIELQDKFYAARKRSLLIIFQAMDAAGKDSAIKHVMSGVNPQGCQVFSFKQPGPEDELHDFLWRHNKALPEKGRIGIHNRSHYENVLVCRVHPELVLKDDLPGVESLASLDKEFWHERFKSINHFEKHLADNGTVILKFFLHISRDKQRERFLKRIDDKSKNWKFSGADLNERAFWDHYMQAYQEAIRYTSTKEAPWFVIPANHKWFTRVAVISVIVEALQDLSLHYPHVSEDDARKLNQYRNTLINEKNS
ncbi:polyphosphate kinase 2 family protein [Arcticibacter sp. MXS-1]|uniref:polyphosphate kinase 2 family protein n=1 Tax=Arcticibacter sp. MXS-1 TaxID=3341726 RepID=UPI0035A82EE6